MNFNCIFCGVKNLSLDELVIHINEHKNLTPKTKTEFLDDNYRLFKKESGKKERKLYSEKLAKASAEEVEKFKKKVLIKLRQYKIDAEHLENIQCCKSIDKIIRYINSKLSMHREELIVSGIKLGTKYKKGLKTKRASNTKKKGGKVFFDTTISSIFPLYTPMGNKK